VANLTNIIYMAKFAFMKGMKNLKVKFYVAAKDELKNVFGVSSNEAFRLHAKGAIEPSASEKEGVEAVFLKYGVGAKDIWGDC